MKQLNLAHTPRPHYLRTGEWVEKGERRYFFEGTALFSKDGDQTLLDRDHVNITHVLFTFWNAAHLAARAGLLLPTMRVLSEQGVYLDEIPLDTEVIFVVEVELLQGNANRMKGVATATTRTQTGVLLAKNTVVFLAIR